MRPCSSKVDAKPHQMLPHPQALTLHSLWCHLSLSSPLLVQFLAMTMATIAEQQSSSHRRCSLSSFPAELYSTWFHVLRASTSKP